MTNVYLDHKKGYATVDTGDGYHVVIGSVEEVNSATETELAEMILFSLAVNQYQNMKIGKATTLH